MLGNLKLQLLVEMCRMRPGHVPQYLLFGLKYKKYISLKYDLFCDLWGKYSCPLRKMYDRLMILVDFCGNYP